MKSKARKDHAFLYVLRSSTSGSPLGVHGLLNRKFATYPQEISKRAPRGSHANHRPCRLTSANSHLKYRTTTLGFLTIARSSSLFTYNFSILDSLQPVLLDRTVTMDSLVARYRRPAFENEGYSQEEQQDLYQATPPLSLKFAMPPISNVSR